MVEVLDYKAVRWVGTSVARKILGVSRQRVYQLVRDGRLAGCRVDGVLMISVVSIEERVNWLKNQEEMYGDGKGPRL